MAVFALLGDRTKNGHPGIEPGWPEVREERTRWCVPLAFLTEGETGKKTARR